MADLPITFEIGGRDYTENTASQDGSRPDYSVTKQMPTGSRMSIHLEINNSKDVPRPGELVFVRVTDLEDNVINFFTGQLIELDYQDLTDREALDLQCQGLYYWLSRTFIPRYKSFNPVNFMTAIDAILIMAKLKSGSYPINPFAIVPYGMFPEMIQIETDENITAADAIQTICDLFAVDWYVGDSGATKIANISTTVTDLIFIKKDFDYTGPITTINNTDLSCPPIGMKDIRSVKVKLGLPTPSTVEVGTDVRSLEAKEQLDELLELKDLPFGSNSTQAVFDLPEEVNHIESATILTATQTRALTVKQTEYDPAQADPFGGNEAAFQKMPPAFILKMPVKDFLDTPSETGFIRADYRIKRAYGKVSNTDLEGFLFNQEKWGDSDTPRSVQQIVAGEIQTQVDATALAQGALDAAPKEFLGLEFQTTEDVKLGQAIYYTNDRIPWISGNNRTVIRQIAEKTINTTNDLSLSLGSLIDKTVTCEVVKRSSPMEQIFLAAKQLIARDPGVGKTVAPSGPTDPCDIPAAYSNAIGDITIDSETGNIILGGSESTGSGTVDIDFNAVNDELYKVSIKAVLNGGNTARATVTLGLNDFNNFDRSIFIDFEQGDTLLVVIPHLTLIQAQTTQTINFSSIGEGNSVERLITYTHLLCENPCDIVGHFNTPLGEMEFDGHNPRIVGNGGTTTGSIRCQHYNLTPGDVTTEEFYTFRTAIAYSTPVGVSAVFTLKVNGIDAGHYYLESSSDSNNIVQVQYLEVNQIQNIFIELQIEETGGSGSILRILGLEGATVDDHINSINLTCPTPGIANGVGYTANTGDITIDEGNVVTCDTGIMTLANGTVQIKESVAGNLTIDTLYYVTIRGVFSVNVNPGDSIFARYELTTPAGSNQERFGGVTDSFQKNVEFGFVANLTSLQNGVTISLLTEVDDAASNCNLQLNTSGHKLLIAY